VFASNLSGPAGGSGREIETVTLLAARLGLEPGTDYGAGEEDGLVAALAACKVPALICWKHDQIPTIAAALGDVSPPAPARWPDDRFDVVWVFVRDCDGVGGPRYHFYQVPELLLPGDREVVIQ
jgi:hypothetical protein